MFGPCYLYKAFRDLSENTLKLFFFDSNPTFDRQINAFIKVSFISDYFELSMSSFFSRFDYCNSLYSSVSLSLLPQLQLVENAAAVLLTGRCKWDTTYRPLTLGLITDCSAILNCGKKLLLPIRTSPTLDIWNPTVILWLLNQSQNICYFLLQKQRENLSYNSVMLFFNISFDYFTYTALWSTAIVICAM